MDNYRIERLELITKRLMRRAGKRTSAIISPYPISNAVFGEKVEGIILRYMFPCNGVISKGMVKVSPKPKSPVTINAKIFNDERSIAKGFSTDKKMLSIAPNIPVLAGDCLELSFVPESAQNTTDVWVSFLWKPSVDDAEVKQFLIADLEDNIDKAQKQALNTI